MVVDGQTTNRYFDRLKVYGSIVRGKFEAAAELPARTSARKMSNSAPFNRMFLPCRPLWLPVPRTEKSKLSRGSMSEWSLNAPGTV